ncbi:LOW QUALITY PROTEIN: CDP-alcohol phosphatidyltransferase protein [Colletotrichum tofieldiae]|nr:LOW QUALITY PROTEIN: CDP-alcohol phosphatidyltransferase protein [Colletotrichum tofieldiae]
MPSFKSTFFAVAAAFVATAQADYVINPDTVPLSVRKGWCKDQTYSCPVICREVSTKPVEANECDPPPKTGNEGEEAEEREPEADEDPPYQQALTYGCVCGDGKQPNMSEYSLTLPYHVCQEYGNQCVADCGIGANTCSNNCRVNNPCGAQNPTRVNSTSSAGDAATATASATETANAVFTGIAGETGSSGSGSGSSGAATLEMGRSAGLAVLVGGVIGGVAFLL